MTTETRHTLANPEAGTITGIWRQLVRLPLLAVIRVGLRVNVQGMNNIPPDGTGVLVVCNHLHNADPILVEIVFPRPLHFMAKQELFSFKPLGWLLRKFGNFPVNRGKSDRKAVRTAIARLQHGIAVGMFPEGTRSRTMRMSRPHAGAGLIAIQAGVPILPVAITGSERLPLNGKRPPGQRPLPDTPGIHIRIGKPFMLPETGSDGRRLGPAEATDRMMRSIADLLPEDYRGIYSSSDEPDESADSASSAARTN